MIIERPNEIRRIKEINKWILVYGRRKTGKTFLVNNFIKNDEYFFVKTNKNILTKDSRSISYETFIEILQRSLEDNKTVVIDEFHRLGTDFFDFLHFTKKKGKLILISSTLFLSKKLISGKSALLGLFAEIPIGLINLSDTLNSLRKYNLSNKDKLELAILLREPISVDYLNDNNEKFILNIVLSSIKTVPALVGEIFSEEEREISAIYEGILRAIAIGKITTGEISSHLFSKKLIKKDDPSMIPQYLNNLISFGIIRKLAIFNKKRFIYKLSSPLARIFYYSDEKYNLSERKVNEKEINILIKELMPRIVEDNIREFFADKYGLIESVVESADYDIDGCLLKFRKPEIILEVKWGKIKNEGLIRAKETLNKVSSKRKILFVQDKALFKKIKLDFEVLDVKDLLS